MFVLYTSRHQVYTVVSMRGSSSGIKRIVIELRKEDHDVLKEIKGDKTWRDFIFELVEFKQKVERENKYVARDSLKGSYHNIAKGLNEIGRLIMYEEEGLRVESEHYLASLLPLLISGENVNEKDLIDLYIFITNLVFKHLKDKYKDSDMFPIFEYLRVAIVRELRGDTEVFVRFLGEMCSELKRLDLRKLP